MARGPLVWVRYLRYTAVEWRTLGAASLTAVCLFVERPLNVTVVPLAVGGYGDWVGLGLVMLVTMMVMMMETLKRTGMNWHSTRLIVWVHTCADMGAKPALTRHGGR